MADKPIQIHQHFEPLPGDLTKSIYTVPRGKRLLIEQVATYVCVPKGSGFLVYLTTTLGGTTARWYIPTAFQTTYNAGASDAQYGQQSMRVYADPGTSVGFEIHRNNSVSNAGIEAEISVAGVLIGTRV